MEKLRHAIGPWPLERWFLPLSVLALELVFKASTTGDWIPALLAIVLFSFVFGQLLWLILALFPTERGMRLACRIELVLLVLVFGVEYFVFREFKVFYDLNTVTAGAGDAATGFTGQIVSLVFSTSGIAHVLALLAPAIAYSVVVALASKRSDPKTPAGAHFSLPVDKAPAHLASNEPPKPSHFAPTAQPKKSVRPEPRDLLSAALLALSAHLVCVAFILSSGAFGTAYSSRYNFQNAVTNYGLLTGLRLEVQRTVTGQKDTVSFSESASHKTVKVTAATPDQPEAKQDLGVSAMDIDFNALAAPTSGTWADLDRYCASLTPSSKNAYTGLFADKNLIFVSAEAFCREAIREDITPTLWRMATRGMRFLKYYQFDSAGTTGGECQNLLGMVPTEGGSSVKITADHNNYLTMGNALNRLGYNGWAFHNNTYTYYGRDKTHNNLGYSNGYMGWGNGMEKWVAWQWPQSDLEMVRGTFDELYGDTSPFNVYYMSVSGHSDYGPGANAMSDRYWDLVANLPYSDPVKGYLACNIDLDRAMEYLIARLEEKGIADDTVIVIAADHFPYGLDEDGPLGGMPLTAELYGMESVDTYFQRDHNRLIIWSGCLEDDDPIEVKDPVMGIDILPTLLNLFGCEWDSRLLPGRDVFSDAMPLVFDPVYDWQTDLGTYYASSGEFVPKEGAQVPEGYVQQVCDIVSDKENYCHGVLTSDYFRHVFGDPEDVASVNARAKAEGSGGVTAEQFEKTARRVAEGLRA